jgi:hypothetical protein
MDGLFDDSFMEVFGWDGQPLKRGHELDPFINALTRVIRSGDEFRPGYFFEPCPCDSSIEDQKYSPEHYLDTWTVRIGELDRKFHIRPAYVVRVIESYGLRMIPEMSQEANNPYHKPLSELKSICRFATERAMEFALERHVYFEQFEEGLEEVEVDEETIL